MTARQRQISIGTAMQAYVVLENRGYIEARPKSGYYVRSLVPTKAKAAPGSVLGPAVQIAEKDLASHVLDLALDPSYFPLGTASPIRRSSAEKSGQGRCRGGAFRTGDPGPIFHGAGLSALRAGAVPAIPADRDGPIPR